MTGRGRVYSEVWKRLPVYQRKVLAHFRNHGKWLPKNHFKPKPKSPNLPMPIPLNSPRTTRRKNIETGFNAYWKELNKNNRNTVRNYITRFNAHQRQRKPESPVKPKSPSPKPTYLNLIKYAENINALKTAKARAEWLKAKKPDIPIYQIDSLKQYIKTKNQANKNRRAAKKNLKK